jgi:hypothetical protein
MNPWDFYQSKEQPPAGTAVTTVQEKPISNIVTQQQQQGELNIDDLITTAANKYGVSPILMKSLFKQESGFRPTAVSSKGAVGIGQLMPKTARELGLVVDENNDERLIPEKNVDASTRYLKKMLDANNGDISKALASYNAGLGNVQKYGGVPPPEFAGGETHNYVKSILANYQSQGGIEKTIKTPLTYDKPVQPWDYYKDSEEVANETPNFFKRVYEDFKERGTKLNKLEKQLLTGERPPLEAAINIANQGVAGPLIDVIGEGLQSAFNGANSAIKMLAPNLGDAVSTKIKQGFEHMVNTDVGQAGLKALNTSEATWKDFAAKNPRTAELLGSMFNIATVFSPASKAKAPPSLLGERAQALDKLAGKQIEESRRTFVTRLIQEKETPTIAKEHARRKVSVGEEEFKIYNPVSYFQRYEVIPSKKEKEIADLVMKIPAVSKARSVQGNYNAVYEANIKEAQDLERTLAGMTTTRIDPVVAGSRIQTAMTDLIKSNPTIVGEPALAAKAKLVADKAAAFIKDNPDNPLGMLKARQALDHWAELNKPNVFDKTQDAFTVSLRTARTEMNDMIPMSVDSRRKQNLMYEAQDVLDSKAAIDANTRIGRTLQNVFRVLPLRERALSIMALIGGTSILGAAHTMAPYLTTGLGVALVVPAAGKMIMSSQAKQGASLLIKLTDEAILKSKNDLMVAQLRKDRIALVELLKTSATWEELEKERQKPVYNSPWIR